MFDQKGAAFRRGGADPLHLPSRKTEGLTVAFIVGFGIGEKDIGAGLLDQGMRRFGACNICCGLRAEADKIILGGMGLTNDDYLYFKNVFNQLI